MKVTLILILAAVLLIPSSSFTSPGDRLRSCINSNRPVALKSSTAVMEKANQKSDLIIAAKGKKNEDNEEDFVSLSRGRGEGGTTNQLKTLMEKMPLDEKYALLLQSYAGSIMDRSAAADNADQVFKSMESLYTEMLCLSIRPSEGCARSMLNAGATFLNSEKLAEVLQLVKAGGYLRAFGVMNAQLSRPLVSAALESKQGSLSNSIQVPTDERETEVAYASAVAATGAVYLSLQLLGNTVDSDLTPWATLCGLVGVLASVGDVALRGGKGLKFAAAGVDRLVMRDAEREYHSESAAFLTAYMLGLPCFCFQPEVSEAVKMLRDAPGSMSAYKQPQARLQAAAAAAASRGGSSRSNNNNNGNNNFFGFLNAGSSSGSGYGKDSGSSTKSRKSKSSNGAEGNVMDRVMRSTGLALRGDEAEESYQVSRRAVKQSLIDTDSITAADLAGLGRVLVWMMSPVAAEVQKYGKTVVSDPKRARRFLDAMAAIQKAELRDVARAPDQSLALEVQQRLPHIDVPKSDEDKNALLRWAYFEADTLLRQYGDLVVDVSDYLGSGTSSVGEVVALLEQELA